MRQAAAGEDVQRYCAANLAFHWTIVDAADNEALGAGDAARAQTLLVDHVQTAHHRLTAHMCRRHPKERKP